MSIASAISNAQSKVAAAYTACNNKGATMPAAANQNLSNLATTIGTISTGGSANLTTLSVTPSKTAQTILPTSPVDGYNQVNVSAVTSSIDSNITAGNIRNGVTILGVTGTYGGGGTPLPYTPLEYIATDGTAYIDTGIVATPPRSSELKILVGSSGVYFRMLSGYGSSSGSNAKNFALAVISAEGAVGLTYYYNYGGNDGMPSASYSVTNNKPFTVRTSIKKGSQFLGLKQDNSETWSKATKTQNGSVSSTYHLILFNGYHGGSLVAPAPSGTRLYYCKIYSDEMFTQLVFDGVPALYNGEYGLWDNVSNSFFGNAAASGAFTGA